MTAIGRKQTMLENLKMEVSKIRIIIALLILFLLFGGIFLTQNYSKLVGTLMDLTFETEVLKITSQRRKIILDADNLFRTEREKLDVEKAFEMEQYLDKNQREAAKASLTEYKKQLVLERSFYTTYHDSYIAELQDLAFQLTSSERQQFLGRAIPGLIENHDLRMSINGEKTSAVDKTEKLILLLELRTDVISISSNRFEVEDDKVLAEIETLIEEIDTHLSKQYKLAMEQKKREKDGRGVIEKLFNIIKNT